MVIIGSRHRGPEDAGGRRRTQEDAASGVEHRPRPPLEPIGAEMSCRKRCKREIFKFAQYLFRLVTGTLNTGKADALLPRQRRGLEGGDVVLQLRAEFR